MQEAEAKYVNSLLSQGQQLIENISREIHPRNLIKT